ncbi:MAG: ABC transporter ATP-binding protein [Prolixibacteraceae bacterium]|nr:ABC transporter ATP-binding protein [Prolixibacteraceae bacterium]MBT6005406.1 ABC transporter ATP-binding protein [Prolixibacteraceae bacterium]MBT6764525.1 ABC transporter ATP-binding protein [Prolixibacteraceae bacterium]MBT6997353.1 ABC transporter ATP-binding protein [Prolixibacteraceae bacterium]MBT7397542.1 ABC transporter ATP-binding protein [Prolixibacteraceae bacterium]
MIKAQNIKKSFGNLQVLKGINLEIPQGKIYSIVGASGAGKTTLLQILGTLTNYDSGEVYYHDKKISSLSEKELATFRNKEIGFVFQFHHLLPEFTALENVCIPAYIAKLSKQKAEKKAKELIDYLGLTDRMEHKPSELSGGEKQRVAVARALVNKPSVILADEPSGNLDSANRNELHDLLFKLRDEMGQTFIIVTHDDNFADRSDKIVHIKDGVIE